MEPEPEPATTGDFHQFIKDLDPPMFVVTTAGDGERSGCLVAFTTQVSVRPPRFLVCLSKKNHTYAVAADAEMLAVHALDPGQEGLAKLFGEETGDEVDKLERCDWTPGPGGVPLLSEAAGHFVGRILERLDLGDHVGHVLEPIEVHVGRRAEHLELQQVKDLDPGHPV